MIEIGIITKNYSFIRMPYTECDEYAIYVEYVDQDLRKQREFVKCIPNKPEPDIETRTVPLEYNIDLTWTLPDDVYMDKDHRIVLYKNGFMLNPFVYDYNRVSNMLTINQSMEAVEMGDEITMTYYRDVIRGSILLAEYQTDARLIIKPHLINGRVGRHQIIV